MSPVASGVLIALVASIAYFILRRRNKRELAIDIIAVAGLLAAIIIPQWIDVNARDVQKLNNCVNAVLGFRSDILHFYQLPIDPYGNVVDPDAKNGGASDQRIRLQNSKDSTYTLCGGVRVGDALILNQSASPWKEAPISATAPWSRANISDLYSWSTEALRKSTLSEPVSIFGINLSSIFA